MVLTIPVSGPSMAFSLSIALFSGVSGQSVDMLIYKDAFTGELWLHLEYIF